MKPLGVAAYFTNLVLPTHHEDAIDIEGDLFLPFAGPRIGWI